MKIRISHRSGSLRYRTICIANQAGEEVEYPKIEGERQSDTIEHWYWSISWKEKDASGKFSTKTRSVPHHLVTAIIAAIEQNEILENILKILD
jgi:hypothetical protein